MKYILLNLLIFFCAVTGTAQTLTYGQIYNFEVGDIFQSKYATGNNGIAWGPPTYYTDSVVSKSWSNLNDTVFYTIKRQIYVTPSGPDLPAQITDTTINVFYTHLGLDYIFPNQPSCLMPSDTFYTGYCSNVWEHHSNQDINCFEPDIWHFKVIEGAGGPYYYKFYISGFGYTYEYELTYYNKGGIICGSFFNSVNELSDKKNTLALSPNPAYDFINLPTEFRGGNVCIYNSNGQLVSDTKRANGQISLANFKNGIYYLQVIKGNKIWSGKFLKN